MYLRSVLSAFGLASGLALLPAIGHAEEFYIGEPIEQNDLQIVPNYLLGIEMDRMPPGMEMGPHSIHLEVDVHATKNEKHGFPEDAWIPYLTIRYTLTKDGSHLSEAVLCVVRRAST